MGNNMSFSTGLATLAGPIIAAAGILLVPSTVMSGTLLSENFDNPWPAGWTRKWNAESDNRNNGIRSDPADHNNPVLQLYGVDGASASATRPFAFSDNFVVTARVWNGSEPRRDGWGRGSIGLEGGSTLFTFYADGAFPGGDPNLATYHAERWYDVRVHYRRQDSNVVLNYWLDGAYVGERQYTLTNLAAELGANRLELNGGSTVYFDNVNVMNVPEPAILPVMIFAAAAFVRGWRRVGKKRTLSCT
jgi:hypothetical protein